MKAPLPTRIGRYEVVDRLGRGGMGVVYLASDPALGRTVAIKMLTEDNDELRERFAREARSAAALKHANIVTIYDVGEDAGRPFIAMEYLDGETMAEMINRRAPVALGRKLELMKELCAGLGYAHRNGIIHRDIKPANLMITAEGALKILDFGIARVRADATGGGLTRVGMLMGTPHYMSPEQAEGLPVDDRSDIFSVGLVLYEILASVRAFPGDMPHVVLHDVLKNEPRPLREICPDIDSELEGMVAKALAKKPADRYQTLSELARDLRRIQARLQDHGDETVLIEQGSAPGKSKTGGSPTPGSGGRNIPNLREIAGRRAAQIESFLAAASAYFEGGQYEEAIDQCEKAVMINPDESRALEMLHLAHDAINARQVRQWLGEAEACLSGESLTAAERLVGQALELQPESEEAQALRLVLNERRREQERAAERARAVRTAVARARTHMEAGAFDAVVRSASEALAYDTGHGEAKQLMRQALAAIEEREQQAHAQRATEIVAQAWQRASSEDIEGALEVLRAFSPSHPVVSDAIADVERAGAALAAKRREAEERRQQIAAANAQRERDAHEAAQERARVARERERAARERERAEREAEAERARAAAAARLAEARREAEQRAHARADLGEDTLDRQAEDIPVVDEEAQVLDGEETWIVGAPEHRPRWYRNLAVVVPVTVLLIGGMSAGVWQMLRDPAAVEREGPPPPPAVDYGPILEAARKNKDVAALDAIALIRKIPADAREHAEAQELLSSIRSEAAGAAAAARQKAVAANATTQDAFRDGDRQLKQADGLPDPEAAVPAYAEAARSFNRAATAELTPQQLFQVARDAFRAGKTDEAIDYAVRAYQRDSSHKPALEFLNARRADAARQADNARKKAAAAGATAENSEKFKQGLARQQAGATATTLETRDALARFRQATVAFEEAQTGAATQLSQQQIQLANEMKNAVDRAEDLLKARDVAGAQAEIDRIRAKDPANRALQTLESRLNDTRAELNRERDRENANASNRARAVALLGESRGLKDHADAISRLEQARKLDPLNEDVRTALEARRKALSAAPVPPTDVDTPAILGVLDDFAAAYNKKSLPLVKAVYPNAPDSLGRTFAQFEALQWEWVGRKVTLHANQGAGRGAGVEATATVECEINITQRSSRTGESRERTNRVFTLEKSSGRWSIVSYVTAAR